MGMQGEITAQVIRKEIQKEIRKAEAKGLSKEYIEGLKKAADIASDYEY